MSLRRSPYRLVIDIKIKVSSSSVCTVNIYQVDFSVRIDRWRTKFPLSIPLIPTLNFTNENKNLSVFLTAKLIPTLSLSSIWFLCWFLGTKKIPSGTIFFFQRSKKKREKGTQKTHNNQLERPDFYRARFLQSAGGVERRRWCGHDRDLLRGGAAAAAAGFGSNFFYSPNILSIFFFNSLDILLTPRIHDFFRAQGGGSGQVLIRQSNLALTQVPIHQEHRAWSQVPICRKDLEGTQVLIRWSNLVQTQVPINLGDRSAIQVPIHQGHQAWSQVPIRRSDLVGTQVPIRWSNLAPTQVPRPADW